MGEIGQDSELLDDIVGLFGEFSNCGRCFDDYAARFAIAQRSPGA